jgi:hypothetical protein
MLTQVRRHTRLEAVVLLALAQLIVVACDKMPLAAPSGSSVTLRTATEMVPLGGSTEVTASVFESGGTPVQNGTIVRFTTNLGRLDPVEAQTRNGLAVTTFLAGDTSGQATVRAISGGVGDGGTTPTNTATLLVGAAAVESVEVRANPQFVPFSGGTVQLIATVFGRSTSATGAAVNTPMRGIPVTFASTQGTLGAVQVVSDGNGEARTTLTTDREASVTATAGTKTSAAVTITRRAAPPLASVILTATVNNDRTIQGQSVRLVAAVTITGDADEGVRAVSYRWNFGDDTSATTSGNDVTHFYTTDPVIRIATVEVLLTNGQTVSAQTEFIAGKTP